jgi:hypothetical protein
LSGFESYIMFKRRRTVRNFTLKIITICAVLFGGLQLHGAPVKGAAAIGGIKVSDGDHDLSVEITATVPITPRIATVTDPNRVIIDVPDVLPRPGLEKILVNRGKLKDIRVALLSTTPRVTRVVLDVMALTTPYRLSLIGNKLLVKLGSEAGFGAAPIAAIAKLPVDTRSAVNATAVVAPPPVQSAMSPEASLAHWIFPTLFTTTVLAMLIIALVAHIQNRRAGRGVYRVLTRE